MTKIYSLNSDVKFPDMEHYDMGKASDMALYLAHCDFYPFIDMFPYTVKWGKMAVDMFPNTTERNLTFLLSTQAMWKR